jgi:hypothetical protein
MGKSGLVKYDLLNGGIWICGLLLAENLNGSRIGGIFIVFNLSLP